MFDHPNHLAFALLAALVVAGSEVDDEASEVEKAGMRSTVVRRPDKERKYNRGRYVE
jgi:hypothetical protein